MATITRKVRPIGVRRWDVLDITRLMDACLDAFSVEFYGMAFDQLEDKDAVRVLNTIRLYVQDLHHAQKGGPR